MDGIPDALKPFCRSWLNQPRPKGHRRQMAMGACYYNAARLAFRGSLTYVEGVAGTAARMVPHAWVVDADGMVIDRTWVYSPTAIYVGVPMLGKFVAVHMLKSDTAGPIIEAAAIYPPAEAIAVDLLARFDASPAVAARRMCADAQDEGQIIDGLVQLLLPTALAELRNSNANSSHAKASPPAAVP